MEKWKLVEFIESDNKIQYRLEGPNDNYLNGTSFKSRKEVLSDINKIINRRNESDKNGYIFRIKKQKPSLRLL
jgi:hypothetical protein